MTKKKQELEELPEIEQCVNGAYGCEYRNECMQCKIDEHEQSIIDQMRGK